MGATKKSLIQQNEDEQGLSPLDTQLDRNSINAKVAHIEDAVLNGEVNPLEAFVYLKWMEEISKQVREKIMDLSITEAEKYPEKEIELFGCKIQKKSAAGKWDFAHLPEVNRIETLLKDTKEQAKTAYHSFQRKETISTEDGEIIEPAKYTPGRDTIAITFKK